MCWQLVGSAIKMFLHQWCYQCAVRFLFWYQWIKRGCRHQGFFFFFGTALRMWEIRVVLSFTRSTNQEIQRSSLKTLIPAWNIRVVGCYPGWYIGCKTKGPPKTSPHTQNISQEFRATGMFSARGAPKYGVGSLWTLYFSLIVLSATWVIFYKNCVV